MKITPQEKKTVEKIKKAAANVNSACIKGGQKLAKETERYYKETRRKESVRNSEAMAKDLAHHFAGMAKDRKIFSTNLETKCLLCAYRKGHLDRCLPCQDFSNFKEA